MILDYGIAHLEKTWQVEEIKAPGYSRVYYLNKGFLYYEGEGHQVTLKPDHLYILPSTRGYKISLGAFEEKICTYLHMDLSPIIVENLIEFDLAKNSLISSYINTIYLSIAEEQKDLLYQLAEGLPIILENFADLKKLSKEMTAVVDHITTNLSEKLDIKQLADIAGYNTNYFIKLFKDTFGISPYQYVLRKRLQQALPLLLEKQPVAAAAEAAGFTDSSSFSRAFKNYYSIKPSQFCDKYFIP